MRVNYLEVSGIMLIFASEIQLLNPKNEMPMG